MTETPNNAVVDQLARLQQAGARGYHPVRFHYLESLARRLLNARTAPSSSQEEKLERALADFRTEFFKAKEEAEKLLETLTEQNAGDTRAQQLFDTGDFKGLHRLAARRRQHRQPSRLAQLVEALSTSGADQDQTGDASSLEALLQEQQALLQHNGGGATAQAPRPRRELKALRHLRAAQAQLRTQQRIHHAIAQTPSDAGPLNAHRQVTRAIETLSEISPDYLKRFVEYVDTLMVLEKMAKKG